ncbi:unnamed protein product [Didymodactylos carnosus]|uniref:PPPDE domain-containing protein n=1 Tax=Didymodactylos carnosus TaxID=1234261 RepID=A0A814RLN6_9BILA|nr:unnamed protein product [Didymodactylos carnosus]CAF3788652.1 unnamed protein product [Didymodactylos carnosus]CAF3899540.1 unnamed protein product [Didymodactylos carnosus]
MGYIQICDDADDDENVVEVRERACRILHGGVSWAVTGLLNIFTLGQSHPLEHRWIEIETDRAFYNVQLYDSGALIMNSARNTRQTDLMGLKCAGKPSDADVWNISKYRYPFTEYENDPLSLSGKLKRLSIHPPGQPLSLGKIKRWLNAGGFPAYYDLIKHNCQHFADAFCQRFCYRLVTKRVKEQFSVRHKEIADDYRTADDLGMIHNNLIEYRRLRRSPSPSTLSCTLSVFQKEVELLLKRWREIPDIVIFANYFKEQWVVDLKYWYEGAAMGIPSINNGLESLNGKIRQIYTLRITIPMMCAYKTNLKSYVCKHALGMMIHLGYYFVQAPSKLEHFSKRRDRPKKARLALMK